MACIFICDQDKKFNGWWNVVFVLSKTINGKVSVLSKEKTNEWNGDKK